MSKAKKVILVIVEGPTDEDALSSVLKQIFSSAEVHFHVIYGDITTEDAITANNAKSYVAKRIAAEMKKYAYKESDILQIVHGKLLLFSPEVFHGREPSIWGVLL